MLAYVVPETGDVLDDAPAGDDVGEHAPPVPALPPDRLHRTLDSLQNEGRQGALNVQDEFNLQ